MKRFLSFLSLFLLVVSMFFFTNCTSSDESVTGIPIQNQSGSGFYTSATLDSNRRIHNSNALLPISLEGLYMASPCLLKSYELKQNAPSQYLVLVNLGGSVHSNCEMGTYFRDTTLFYSSNQLPSYFVIWGYPHFKIDTIKTDKDTTYHYSDRFLSPLDTILNYPGSNHDTLLSLTSDSLGQIVKNNLNAKITPQVIYKIDPSLLLKVTIELQCSSEEWNKKCPQYLVDTNISRSKDTLFYTFVARCEQGNISKICPLSSLVSKRSDVHTPLDSIPVYHWVYKEDLDQCQFWNRKWKIQLPSLDTLNSHLPPLSIFKLRREIFKTSDPNFCNQKLPFQWDLQKDSVISGY